MAPGYKSRGGNVGTLERSLEEVKAEILRRTGSINPLDGIRREDVEPIVASLTSLDRDHWAQAWCQVGLAHEAKADERAKAGAAGHELAELYEMAFDICRMGRYPVANSPGKKQAYAHSLRLFRKAAQHFEVPLAIVEIPFESKTLVGYLQIPPGVTKPPIVMHWGGVDGWKEDRQRQSGHLHRLGIATLTVDMPGTGESPVLYGDAAVERTYTAWLDHLAQRTDIDGSRVGVWGGSFGAYWAARLAYVAPTRIAGAVFQGGNVHLGFQRDWLVPAFTTGGATYLFGAASLLEARGQAMGTKTLEEFLEAAPKLSLVTLGLIDQPSAPILGLNGKLDDQAPVADIYLLLEHGSPKEARIYPQGRHMGRTPGMPEDEIFATIAGWLKGKLARYVARCGCDSRDTLRCHPRESGDPSRLTLRPLEYGSPLSRGRQAVATGRPDFTAP
jgi:esterase FrsA